MQSNQRGQAAIVVALMFNVLFIFFAMAINIGMVVHDKINLQNSVDLASYYAAMKQAEILNVIAHENYQIRQSWKLLAWRYHVLGTMGIYRAPSPTNPVWSGETSDTVYPPAVKPVVCVTYKPTWKEVPENESLCNTENLRIPPLPQVQVIAGFLGINAGIAALSNQLRAQFDAQCEKHGAYNWWFAMGILHAFRVDQRNRKRIIYALGRDLAGLANGAQNDNGDFVDLDGNSVLEGARQTFVKNLTYANRASFESGGGEFKLYNSLAGIDPHQWLVEVQTVPTILYTDVDNSPGCNASTQPIANLPQRPGAQALLLNGLNAADLEQWRTDRFLQDSDYQFSMGVEKNPWYMAYMGVQARTTPRQIFFPFGGGISMFARSFAKPFGGRIGPWYQSQWDKGSPHSTGELVDPLGPPRMEAGGLMNDPNDPRRLPNYSRYPGDTLGMESKLAINGLSGLNAVGISFGYYGGIYAEMGQGEPNDPLAWDALGNAAPQIRDYEIQAIAPDLFDITYYSIEPDFANNYFHKLTAHGNALGIPSDTIIRPDLGVSPLLPDYSVQDQMALAKQKGNQRPEAFYFVRDKMNLLTSWLPGPGAFNYDISSAMAHFGQCQLTDDKYQSKFKVPGSCVAGGGRTGASVKLIARDALFSEKHKIGGPSAAAGAILNPPNAGRNW